MIAKNDFTKKELKEIREKILENIDTIKKEINKSINKNYFIKIKNIKLVNNKIIFVDYEGYNKNFEPCLVGFRIINLNTFKRIKLNNKNQITNYKFGCFLNELLLYIKNKKDIKLKRFYINK